MQREIKFRVWNGFKMEYSIAVFNGRAYYVNNGSPNPDQGSINPMNTVYSKNVRLMQWTGDMDRNGIPIYESDIVLDMADQFVTSDFRIELEVYWDDALLGFSCRKESYQCPVPNSLDCEVIGNIYENQELLK